MFSRRWPRMSGRVRGILTCSANISRRGIDGPDGIVLRRIEEARCVTATVRVVMDSVGPLVAQPLRRGERLQNFVAAW